MKPSEERYTAWVDGLLSAEDAAALERELGEALPDAKADRAAAAALGRLLREQTPVPPMPNADFFRHHLLETIRREESAASPAQAAPSPVGLPLWRLFWATAACATVGCLLAFSLSVETGGSTHARILNARPGGPGISAVPIHSTKANATVLWLDGLDYLSALPAEGRR